jgi:hypothetical protein
LPFFFYEIKRAGPDGQSILRNIWTGYQPIRALDFILDQKTIINFISSVVRRVVRLLSRLAVSEASAEASIKQAKSASEQCQRLMADIEKLEKVMTDNL